ncbi:MAG: hypothetical protein GWP08_14155 [Nitrospiraceae bacterium]|nr:hypothetical protein [Nitrospiraceae bacterium]
MQETSIEEAKPGHVLIRNVFSTGGTVLCREGFVLTDNALDRLKRAGVESVVIKGTSESKVSNSEERVAALNRRFEGIDDKLMLQIRALIEHRLMVGWE